MAALLPLLCYARLWAVPPANCDTSFCSYPDSVLCSSAPVMAPDSAFPASGFFRTPSAGLSLDSLGNINPGLSTSGLHEVQYIALDSCADTFRVFVQILPTGNPAFTYPDTLFCVPGPDPFPVIAGDSGGVFSGPPGLEVDSVTGRIYTGLSSVGSYIVSYTVDSLCPDSATFGLSIQNRGDASFLYPDTAYCSNEPDPSPVILGDAGGRFRSGPGLVLDSLSGVVDLSQSAAGSYLIAYESPGPCPDTVTVSLSVTASEDPTFAYNPFYCISDTVNPVPSVVVSGGLFSASPFGLSFADPQTGEIDLSTSQPGTYQIRYLTPGPCPDSMTVVVTLNDRTPAGFHYPDTTYCNGGGVAAPVVLGQGGGIFFSADTSLALDSLTGFVTLAASDTGTFAVNYTSPGTCPDTATFALSVAAQGVALFDYFPDQFCISDPDPLPVISGDTNGVFSVLFGGALVDPQTGLIDLGGSVPGDSILIQYRVPGLSAACPDSTVRLIRIFAPDSSVSISYPSASYCPDEPDPLPTVTGTAGGSFQAQPPGLAVAQFTGQIDLSQSAPGTYLVRYFPPGACTDTTNGFTLTLNPPDVLTLSYPLGEYCSNEGTAAPVGLSDTLGTFSDNSGFLVFSDPVRGEIDLDSSRAGAYLVGYRSGGACAEDTTFALTIHQSPEAELITTAPDLTICAGDSADFLGFGGDRFAFLVNDSIVRPLGFGNLFRPDFPIRHGDKFGLIVENDIGGCRERDSLFISVRPAPSLSFIEYETTISGDEPFEILFQADLDSVTVDWSFQTAGPISPEQDSGTTPVLRAGGVWQNEHDLTLGSAVDAAQLYYYLTPNFGGCAGRTDSLEILILPGDDVFIPGVITPDGNGANDVWEIRYKPNIRPENWEISVFNRSGGEVWTQNGLAPVWTGGSLPDGVYWYVATERVSGRKLSGGVTIRRK